jgi:hypothetical protein
MRKSEQCVVCGDEAIAVLESGESVRTPGQIDDMWTICVSGSGVFVHAPLAANDWTPDKIQARFQ